MAKTKNYKSGSTRTHKNAEQIAFVRRAIEGLEAVLPFELLRFELALKHNRTDDVEKFWNSADRIGKSLDDYRWQLQRLLNDDGN
jgi:hypothetical protein